MNFDEYQQAARRTMTTEASRVERMTNAALGLSGEAGEVADLVKKFLFHGHLLDDTKLKYELGDQLWYIAQMCEALNITMREVAEMNIDKLLARYPDGFSHEASRNRHA